VDITNFVMLETGQPMHAFDLSSVAQGEIIVRRSGEGETLTALNGESYELPPQTLVIADPEKAVGMAGIMGGENSEITDDTKTVLFESAAFNGANIRRSSRAIGLHSDAASYFIKGVDIEGTAYALERACSLMETLGAGKIDRGVIDVLAPGALERVHFTARPEKICALLGKDVPAEQMRDVMNGLEVPTTLANGVLEVEVPHFRNDIEGEADIAEEVIRVIGQNTIEPTLMRGDLMRGRLTDRQQWVDKLRDALTGLGCCEAMTFSFTGPATYDRMQLAPDSPWRKSVSLQNPFGEDNSLMRSTLATGMLPSIAVNAKRKNPLFRLFEIGNVHRAPENPGELPTESKRVCIGAYGMIESFFTVKGMILRVLQALGISPEQLYFRAGGENCFHPGRKAEIYIGDQMVGQMGEIHPDVAENFSIAGRAYLAELEIEPIFVARRTNIRYRPLSRFPVVSRDLALLVEKEIESELLAQIMREQAGRILESVELFDAYDGQNLPEGRKSLAYSLQFLSNDHTLTDEEVNEQIERILRALHEHFGAELRK
jgi:phenylalanyl-tRNA synthetase, beta subunit, non-spirochete bacterial